MVVRLDTRSQGTGRCWTRRGSCDRRTAFAGCVADSLRRSSREVDTEPSRRIRCKGQSPEGQSNA